MYVSGKPFQPSLMIAGKAGAYPRVEHLEDASLGWAPALPAIIRLGWKGLPETNTLAYYESSQITDRKGFKILTPDYSKVI